MPRIFLFFKAPGQVIEFNHRPGLRTLSWEPPAEPEVGQDWQALKAVAETVQGLTCPVLIVKSFKGHKMISKCQDDVGKLISMMVKHLVSVLCKWLVIKSNASIYLSKELKRKGPAPRASVNPMDMKLWSSTQPVSSDGQRQKTFFFFFFSVMLLNGDHLPSLGLYFFVPFPFALFSKTSTGGHSVSHRADSSSPLLSGLKQI